MVPWNTAGRSDSYRYLHISGVSGNSCQYTGLWRSSIVQFEDRANFYLPSCTIQYTLLLFT